MKLHKWIVISFVLVLSSLPILSNSSAQEDTKSALKDIDSSVVLIRVHDDRDNQIRLYSGFFLGDNGDVVTLRNAFRYASRAEIRTAGGNEFEIKRIVGDEEDGDLVRVSADIPTEFMKMLPLSGSLPEKGEKVWIVQVRPGSRHEVSEGSISVVREYLWMSGNIIQVAAPDFLGSVGTPVLNLKGEVIGILADATGKGPFLISIIPAERVSKLNAGDEISFIQWQARLRDEISELPNVLRIKALEFLKLQKYEEAIICFKRLIRKEPTSEDAYFKLGQTYSKLTRHEEAIKYLKMVVTLNPNMPEAYSQLGLVYGKMKRFEEAIDSIKEYIRLKPREAMARAYLGNLYYLSGRREEAVEAAKEAIRINPALFEGRIPLALAYRDMGRKEDAILVLKESIRLKPNEAIPRALLGNLYLTTGHRQEAFDFLQDAVRLNPRSAEARIELARAYRFMGRKDEAIREAKEAVRLKPDSAPMHSNLAAIYSKFGQPDKALEEYNEALRLQPDSYQVYNMRGTHYSRLRQFDHSLENFNRAMAIKPNWTSYNNRGYTFIKLGRLQEALDDFQKSLEIDTYKKDKFDPYIGLAIVSYLQGKSDEARDYYTKAIEIEPVCKKGADALEDEKGYYYDDGDKRIIQGILNLWH